MLASPNISTILQHPRTLAARVSGDPRPDRLRLAAEALLIGYLIVLLTVPSAVGVSALGIVISPARVLLALALGIGGVAAARVLWRSSRSGLTRPAGTAVLIGVGWVALLGLATGTTLLHPSEKGIARLLSMAIEGGGVFWLGWWLMRRQRTARIVRGTLVGASVLVAALSMGLMAFGLQYNAALESLVGLPLTSEVSRARFGLVRIEGPFGQPLVFATWLVATLPLAFDFLRSPGMWRRVLAVVALFVLSPALLLTVSRSAIAMGACLPAGYLLLVGRYRSAGLAAVVGVPIAVAVLAWSGIVTVSPHVPTLIPSNVGTTPPPVESIPATPDPIQQSGELRLEAYPAAVRAIAERPLLGHGLLNGSEALSRFSNRPNYVDNTYLQVAIEQGLLGLAALGTVLAGVLLHSHRRRSADSGPLVALVALLLLFVIVSFLSFTVGFALFWITAALVVANAPTITPHRRPVAG